MTTLTTLLRKRASVSNLGNEKTTQGVVYYKSAAHSDTQGTTFNSLTCPACRIWGNNEYCWKSPGTGRAVVEVWGPGGISPRMCCCASPTLPANPGAYSRKTINVTSSSFVCGIIGNSCGAAVTAAGNLCVYGSRGLASCLTLCHVEGCSCMCVMGGCGGVIYCMTGVNSCAIAACFNAAGFDITYINDCYCSIICNNKSCGASANQHAIAYGGDVNVNGVSSNIFIRCIADACDMGTRVENRLSLPAGYFTSDAPFYLSYLQSTDCTIPSSSYNAAYSGRLAMTYALAAVTGQIAPHQACWAGALDCTCYENNGATPLPAGYPAPTGMVRPTVRTTGHVGGHGAVKITYLES